VINASRERSYKAVTIGLVSSRQQGACSKVAPLVAADAGVAHSLVAQSASAWTVVITTLGRGARLSLLTKRPRPLHTNGRDPVADAPFGAIARWTTDAAAVEPTSAAHPKRGVRGETLRLYRLVRVRGSGVRVRIRISRGRI
jgi:hypothetical protein